MRAKHVAAVSVLYVLVYMGALLSAFGAAMHSMDTGAPGGTLQEVVAGPVVAVLRLPLLPIVPGQWFPGVTGYIPLFVNGMIWAVVLLAVTRLVRERTFNRSSEFER